MDNLHKTNNNNNQTQGGSHKHPNGNINNSSITDLAQTVSLDPLQLQEWLDSIDNIIEHHSEADIKLLINKLSNRITQKTGLDISSSALSSAYINTIDVARQKNYPSDTQIANKVLAYVRWNAVAMVLKANKVSSELGGHIASYASSASLYEVGFNHFWRTIVEDSAGDLVFFQGHSSPGIYARSFLEGRLSSEQLHNYRQEAFKNGLSSYPHPWLMPEYWSLPTVSMGLGPLMAIYQARFIKYLDDRGIKKAYDRKVWCFIGDGETSEPETLGNIHIASRDKLDNLIFVINCNLQRLDGPVNGNGKIIQELESLFKGANWKTIKIIWGKTWDNLLKKDISGKLQEIMMSTIDGEYQTYRAKNGAYIREHFFGKTPETLALVQDMTDDDIWRLTRGGHDLDKIHAAYYEAVHNNSGKPVVILAKTIKGFGMVGEGESQNIAHQQKKLSTITLQKIRDQFQIPLSNEQIEDLPFLELEANTPEYNYLHERRKELGGYYPKRTITKDSVIVPNLAAFNTVLYGLQTREISTTMAFVRILNILLKDNNLKSRIVPIVPDESRTFGMEGMFRQLGIWSHVGQLYTPEDASQLMFYKEDVKGQIFQEGINEPGAISTWIAAATSYSNHDITMIPFYIYYSMFGFQRVGDLAWAAGDMRARGFLIGATSGRTTLNGEGLQHEDGHSHIQAGLIPNCETYDPTFAHELAVIVQHGLEEMYVLNQDKFYYITVMNENYSHYDYNENYKDGIIRGCYLLKQQIVDDKKLQNSIEQYRLKTSAKSTTKLIVNLLGSGSILREAIFAAEILSAEYGIDVNLFSATSFNKLYKDGISVDRHNILTPSLEWQAPYISQLFYDTFEATYTTNAQSYLEDSVTVAATDYIRSYANQVRAYIPTQYYVLGTDGFGRSDFRVELRKYFEVNRYYIILTALYGLVQKGFIDKQILLDTMKKYDIDSSKQNPWEV